MYEEPDQAELVLRTENRLVMMIMMMMMITSYRPVADCVQELIEILQNDGIVPRSVVEKVMVMIMMIMMI